jgi:hypothetical protein
MPGMIAGILYQHESEKARTVTAAELMTSHRFDYPPPGPAPFDVLTAFSAD